MKKLTVSVLLLTTCLFSCKKEKQCEIYRADKTETHLQLETFKARVANNMDDYATYYEGPTGWVYSKMHNDSLNVLETNAQNAKEKVILNSCQ